MERNEKDAGLPDFGKSAFLVIGKLRRPHGVIGEIMMEIITDFPQHINVGNTVFIGEERKKFCIRELREHRNQLLITFDGIDSREDVNQLTNNYVYIPTNEVQKLPEGEYYHHELLGIRVFDEQNKELGKLVDILETGANDVYVIQPGDKSGYSGKEILLPAIKDVILEIDLISRRMVVRPQQWI